MSEFKFACPVCGQHITCDSGSSGTQMDCPTCFRNLVVPQAKASGGSNLVLTAALVQSRPATSVTSQTELISKTRPAKKLPVAGFILLVLLAGAGVSLFVFRSSIFHRWQVQSSLTNHPVKPDVPIIAATPGATDWTLNLAGAEIPDKPANGIVNGRGFKLERATIQQGRLDLRQGAKWPPDVGVSVHLFAERTEDLAGRIVIIEATRTNPPRTILRWRNEQGQPVNKDQRRGYALKVEFGQVTNNQLPGKIFIAFSDEPRSYVAGTFNADIRRPSPKK